MTPEEFSSLTNFIYAKGDLSSVNGLGEIDAVQAEIAKILG